MEGGQISRAQARSFYFSLVEGRHLPHYLRCAIENALTLLEHVDPEARRVLRRFHEHGVRTNPAEEERAADKLTDCLRMVWTRRAA